MPTPQAAKSSAPAAARPCSSKNRRAADSPVFSVWWHFGWKVAFHSIGCWNWTPAVDLKSPLRSSLFAGVPYFGLARRVRAVVA